MPKITQSFQLYYNETLYGKKSDVDELYLYVKRRTDITKKTAEVAYKIFEQCHGKSTIDWHFACSKAAEKTARKYSVVKDNTTSDVHTLRMQQLIKDGVFKCTKGFFLHNDQRII